MAQGNQGTQGVPQGSQGTPNAALDWKVAAAKRGYMTLDGKVYHGSGGNIVELPEPDWNNPGVRSMVAQAVIEYVTNRIVQGESNGKAQEVATKALREGDGDGSDDESGRTKILEKLVRDEITAMAKAKMPNVTDAQLEKTIDAYHDKIARVIVNRGKYTIARKGKNKPGETGAEAVELEL